MLKLVLLNLQDGVLLNLKKYLHLNSEKRTICARLARLSAASLSDPINCVCTVCDFMSVHKLWVLINLYMYMQETQKPKLKPAAGSWDGQAK